MTTTPAEGLVGDGARALLELRAARLREVRDAGDDDESSWVAELSVGGMSYALALGDLFGVVPLRAVVSVPLAPSQVLGIVRFRGELVTAYSLAWLLEAQGWTRDPNVLVVAGLRSGRKVAFDCEEVPQAMALRSGSDAARALAERDRADAVVEVQGGARPLRLVRLERLLEQRLGSAWSRG